jgi:predicted metal-binding membrane protein
MGLHHGYYCLGCCWFLMALLFVGGVMNLYWIIGLAVFVFAEKALRGGRWLTRTSGALLVIWGLASISAFF